MKVTRIKGIHIIILSLAGYRIPAPHHEEEESRKHCWRIETTTRTSNSALTTAWVVLQDSLSQKKLLVLEIPTVFRLVGAFAIFVRIKYVLTICIGCKQVLCFDNNISKEILALLQDNEKGPHLCHHFLEQANQSWG